MPIPTLPERLSRASSICRTCCEYMTPRPWGPYRKSKQTLTWASYHQAAVAVALVLVSWRSCVSWAYACHINVAVTCRNQFLGMSRSSPALVTMEPCHCYGQCFGNIEIVPSGFHEHWYSAMWGSLSTQQFFFHGVLFGQAFPRAGFRHVTIVVITVSRIVTCEARLRYQSYTRRSASHVLSPLQMIHEIFG